MIVFIHCDTSGLYGLNRGFGKVIVMSSRPVRLFPLWLMYQYYTESSRARVAEHNHEYAAKKPKISTDVALMTKLESTRSLKKWA